MEKAPLYHLEDVKVESVGEGESIETVAAE
jgi:hypothetical protein